VSLSATSKCGTRSNEVRVQITHANYVAGNTTGRSPTVAGSLTNPGSATLDSPISVGIYCFTGSVLTAVNGGVRIRNSQPGASGLGELQHIGAGLLHDVLGRRIWTCDIRLTVQ